MSRERDGGAVLVGLVAVRTARDAGRIARDGPRSRPRVRDIELPLERVGDGHEAVAAANARLEDRSQGPMTRAPSASRAVETPASPVPASSAGPGDESAPSGPAVAECSGGGGSARSAPRSLSASAPGGTHVANIGARV